MSSELHAAAATHQQTVTLDDLVRISDVLRKLPPEPIGEWMRERGYPPEEWILIAPAGMRPEGSSEMLVPSYVRFSRLVPEPVFIRPPGFFAQSISARGEK